MIGYYLNIGTYNDMLNSLLFFVLEEKALSYNGLKPCL